MTINQMKILNDLYASLAAIITIIVTQLELINVVLNTVLLVGSVVLVIIRIYKSLKKDNPKS